MRFGLRGLRGLHGSRPCEAQASMEKKLKAANLGKRNADRANELTAVMRQVQPLHT